MTALKARLIAYNDWQAAEIAAQAGRGRHSSGLVIARRPRRPSVMAERFARAVEASVSPPTGHGGAVCRSAVCEHCLTYNFAQGVAAMARRWWRIT